MDHPWQARADTASQLLLEQLSQLLGQQFVSDDPQADLEGLGLQTSPQTPD